MIDDAKKWHSILLWGPGSKIWRGPLMHNQGLLAAQHICNWHMDLNQNIQKWSSARFILKPTGKAHAIRQIAISPFTHLYKNTVGYVLHCFSCWRPFGGQKPQFIGLPEPHIAMPLMQSERCMRVLVSVISDWNWRLIFVHVHTFEMLWAMLCVVYDVVVQGWPGATGRGVDILWCGH